MMVLLANEPKYYAPMLNLSPSPFGLLLVTISLIQSETSSFITTTFQVSSVRTLTGNAIAQNTQKLSDIISRRDSFIEKKLLPKIDCFQK